MNKLTIYHADAFTDHVFGGNPAAICILNHWIPTSIMQSIANENNLAETAFLVKEKEQYHIRWFTPTVEVDLCGHATLAAAHILYEFGFEDGPIINFNSQRSGPLQVEKGEELLILNFPADELSEIEFYPEIHEVFDIRPSHVFKGKTDYMLVYHSQEEIERIEPDILKIEHLDCRGVIVTAPGNDVDFVSRFFAPQSGVLEDPVTGSAHTTLTPYWSKRLEKTKLTARQISARGGYLKLEDCGDRVKIGGIAITYLKGEIYF